MSRPLFFQRNRYMVTLTNVLSFIPMFYTLFFTLYLCKQILCEIFHDHFLTHFLILLFCSKFGSTIFQSFLLVSFSALLSLFLPDALYCWSIIDENIEFIKLIHCFIVLIHIAVSVIVSSIRLQSTKLTAISESGNYEQQVCTGGGGP